MKREVESTFYIIPLLLLSLFFGKPGRNVNIINFVTRQHRQTEIAVYTAPCSVTFFFLAYFSSSLRLDNLHPRDVIEPMCTRCYLRQASTFGSRFFNYE